MANKEKAAKKAGQDTSKKRRRMRAAEVERHRNAAPKGPSHDRVDKIKFKRGSEQDSSMPH